MVPRKCLRKGTPFTWLAGWSNKVSFDRDISLPLNNTLAGRLMKWNLCFHLVCIKSTGWELLPQAKQSNSQTGIKKRWIHSFSVQSRYPSEANREGGEEKKAQEKEITGRRGNNVKKPNRTNPHDIQNYDTRCSILYFQIMYMVSKSL